MTQPITLITQHLDGRWLVKIIDPDTAKTVSGCTHRHWTKITAKSCAEILVRGVSRIEGEEE